MAHHRWMHFGGGRKPESWPLQPTTPKRWPRHRQLPFCFRPTSKPPNPQRRCSSRSAGRDLLGDEPGFRAPARLASSCFLVLVDLLFVDGWPEPFHIRVHPGRSDHPVRFIHREGLQRKPLFFAGSSNNWSRYRRSASRNLTIFGWLLHLSPQRSSYSMSTAFANFPADEND